MMNGRITKEWTPTLVEAYGPSAQPARDAELLVIKYLKKYYTVVNDYESDYDKQINGQDIGVSKDFYGQEYFIDVKNNLTKFGEFSVETNEDGWLFKKSNRIYHVNLESKWCAAYYVENMIELLRKKDLLNRGKITIQNKKQPYLDFVKRFKLT